MFETKKQKQKILRQHKVVFDADHPVWRLAADIPDPTWDDIKWFRRYKKLNKKDRQYHLYYNFQAGRLWRVAKAMEMRRAAEWQDTLHLNQYLEFEGCKATVLNAPFLTEQKITDKFITGYKILLTEEAAPFKWVDNSFELFANPENKELIQLLIDEKMLSVEQQAKIFDILNINDSRKPKVEKLQALIGDQTKTETTVENWAKVSDTMIAQTKTLNDGSSLRRIFDFAAQSVKTIERVPGEVPATFENHFNDVANDDLQLAANQLIDKDGHRNFDPHRKISKPLPGR